MKNKIYYLILIAFLLFSIFYVGDKLLNVSAISEKNKVILLSNQTLDDLQLTYLKSINEAKESILLIVYGLTDYKLINALKKKAESGIKVEVIADHAASQGVKSKLGKKIDVTLRRAQGLMHQKILVIDQEKVWIGSANFTVPSLKMHGNLIGGFYNPDLAKLVYRKGKMLKAEGKIEQLLPTIFNIDESNVEMWFLPDGKDGVKRVQDLIKSAKKSIKVAMFTFTRQDFAKSLIEARKRGVQTEVVIDSNSMSGASGKVAKLFRDNDFPVRRSLPGDPLLHHKLMIIDDHIIVNGSANWTIAAFTKNDDCFFVLYNLNEKQNRHLNKLWRVITNESELVN